jgi:hypothetical protein
MAYTARNLITDAYYLSGIVSRDLQEVSGDQLINGKNLLNGILAVKTLDNKLIPYYKQYDFDAVVGQEKYFIENLISIETFVFYIDSVRFSSSPIGREYYFGTPRPENIKSLPFNWHAERVYNGTDLYVYFLPDKAYPLTIWGKFMLSVVDENTDLSTTFDNFYLVYLRYALAEFICSDYNITFQPQSANKLKELESLLTYVSPKDVSVRKLSTLRGVNITNWGDYNIGKGWRP